MSGCESRHIPPPPPKKKNTMLKWRKWFQGMYFNKEGRRTYEKFTKKRGGEETASGKLRVGGSSFEQ